MKRTYQGYSGPAQTNPNLPAPPTMPYPPLPSGQPPPQPSGSPSQPPNSQYQQPQPPANSVAQAASQPYPYSAQYTPAAGSSYAQYPAYPHPQPASGAYPGTAFNQLGTQQQPAQQQQQAPQHPAYANYGYGTPAGPQQPPKAAQPYPSYPPPGNNTLPPNPHASIPPNPFAGYPAGQVNAPHQNPPGNAPGQPPFKRPRYENNGGAGYGSSAQPPSNPNSHNHKMNQAPSGTMRMGASTNNNRGGFSGNRPPRSTGAPFGNNSPIRLNSSGPHYDPSQQNHAQPMGQNLPPYHQPPQGPNNPSYPTPNFADTTYSPFPASTGYPPANGDHSNTTIGGPPRMNHFPSDFSGGANFGAGPESSNDPFRAPGSNHSGNPHRPTRGGFRGASVPGGRSSRDREMGPPDAMTSRPTRGFGNNIFSFNKSDRQGPGGRGRNTNGHSTNRSEDHTPNYSGTGGGGSRYGDRSSGPSNRGSRSISNLPTLAFHRGGIERRGGGVGSSRGMGDRSSAARLGRRTNGRDLKFEDRKTLHRMGRGGAPGSNSGGDRGDRAKLNGGVVGVRVKNGWGAQFKEFNDREKDREKVDENAPRRTLTDFRIVALRVPDIDWDWVAESAEPTVEFDSSAIAANIEESQIKSNSSPAPKLPASATKQDADVASGENGKIPPPTKADAPLAGEEAKSVGTIEMAKKIYDDAASAVTGLDLAIDDANSDNEEQALEREVNDQLLPKSRKTTPKPHGTDSIPLTAEQPKAPGSPPHPEASTNHSSKGEDLPRATSEDGESLTIITHAPASLNVTPALAPQSSDRLALTKPSLPDARENSRLRLYFSSPAIEATAGPSLSVKPLLGFGAGKRKLSVSGTSAVSGDARLGGVALGTSTISVDKKDTPAPESSKVVANPTPDIVEIPNPVVTEPSRATDAPAEDAKSAVSDPVAQPSSEKPLGEESKVCEAIEEDPDAECEDEEDENEDYENPPIPEPKADRLSISYARNTRRLVIDADVVEEIKVYRAAHKIEVLVKLMPAIIQGGKFDGAVDVYRICKGVVVEAYDPELKDYVVLDRPTLEASWLAKEQEDDDKAKAHDEAPPTEDGNERVVHDPLLPPLHRLYFSKGEPTPDESQEAQQARGAEVKPTQVFKKDTILIVADIDTANPLTEAKWVRTGDVDSWISQMTGVIFKPEETGDCGWRRKITVVDPEPAPTIQHLLDTWLTTSNVGTIDSRQRFIDQHVIKNVDVIIEILLRVIRNGGNNPSTHHINPMPLIVQQAATLHAPYPEQQTQVSLAVLGLYRLSVDTALEAGKPVRPVIRKATDIVRSLPYRLAFSALDGIYKDEHP
ncbi:hypothetical protein PCANC_20172 [Puccinia coronata f. sp. avenae]|uniref:Uncharacterized protein n=2 Tax=Puccinia coronata f. sp. avenae TaxID=200324 RepID=A0A2N5SGK7_9BASI|nr:hypothetical protein PCANC_20172 [Puccinia coronata f. sp. avenae]